MHSGKEAHVIHLRKRVGASWAPRREVAEVEASRRVPQGACARARREEYRRGRGVVEGARPGTAGSRRRDAGVRQSVVVTRTVASVRQCIRVPRTGELVCRRLFAPVIACTFTLVFTFGGPSSAKQSTRSDRIPSEDESSDDAGTRRPDGVTGTRLDCLISFVATGSILPARWGHKGSGVNRAQPGKGQRDD